MAKIWVWLHEIMLKERTKIWLTHENLDMSAQKSVEGTKVWTWTHKSLLNARILDMNAGKALSAWDGLHKGLFLIFTGNDFGYKKRLCVLKQSFSQLTVEQQELYKCHKRAIDTNMVLFVMYPVCFVRLFQLLNRISRTRKNNAFGQPGTVWC